MTKASPEGTFLIVTLGIGVVLLFRAYARSLAEHRTLGQVYEFAQTVDDATASRDGAYLAIEAVREMLNADRAQLWVPPVGDVDGRRAAAHADGSRELYVGPHRQGDPLRTRVRNERIGILFGPRTAATEAELAAVRERGAVEVIGVPLNAGDGEAGYMEVCDRRGDRLMFSASDVQLMESLATHVSAASQNVALLTQLRYDATHDRLTGLPNRVRLAQLVEEMRPALTPAEPELAVLMIDFDSVEQVNDTLGHEAGDELIKALTGLLAQHAPEGSRVGRTGADVFAVLLPVADLDDAEERARALRRALSVPCEVSGVTVDVSATIGLALCPLHDFDSVAVLRRADVALYAGRSDSAEITSYQPAMDQSSLRRLHLGTQIREAMLSGQIFAVFQPLIDVRTNEVRATETLVRWQHPRYGTVAPDDFIPLAEHIGMINPLTMHVLGLALRQCRNWLDRDIRIEVAVNLSARSLVDTSFALAVAEALQRNRVPAELLTFEITESSVMADPDTAVSVLQSLHELGVGLAIDDFGTGYSSLAYLRRLPVDEVKIDKAFISNMGTDIGDAAITRAIIELAHSLALKVVAEGVEDELTRDLLAEMGCDTIQGYLVSRPLPGPRLDLWLSARTAARPAVVAGNGRRLFITARGPLLT